MLNRANCSGTFAAISKLRGLAGRVRGPQRQRRHQHLHGRQRQTAPSTRAIRPSSWASGRVHPLDEDLRGLGGSGPRAGGGCRAERVGRAPGSSKLYRLDGQTGAVMKTIDVAAETGVTTLRPPGAGHRAWRLPLRVGHQLAAAGAEDRSQRQRRAATWWTRWRRRCPPSGSRWPRRGGVAGRRVRLGQRRGAGGLRGAHGSGGGRWWRLRRAAPAASRWTRAGDVWAACWAANRLLRVSSSGGFLGTLGGGLAARGRGGGGGREDLGRQLRQ